MDTKLVLVNELLLCMGCIWLTGMDKGIRVTLDEKHLDYLHIAGNPKGIIAF